MPALRSSILASRCCRSSSMTVAESSGSCSAAGAAGSLLGGVGDVDGRAAISALPSSDAGAGGESSGTAAAARCTLATGDSAAGGAMAASAVVAANGGSARCGGDTNPDAAVPGSNSGTDATVDGWRGHQSGRIRPAVTSAGGASNPSRKAVRLNSREGRLPTASGREPIATPHQEKRSLPSLRMPHNRQDQRAIAVTGGRGRCGTATAATNAASSGPRNRAPRR